jgi:SPP1 gp7 family putative phage head morphogenesis protein
MPSGGSIENRIMLSFERLARDIQDAVQLSFVRGDDITTTLARVMKAFPKTRDISSTPALTRRKLKEADFEDEELSDYTPSVSITDQDLWDDILTDYRTTTLPDDIFKRGPHDKTLFYDVDTGMSHERYTWEVEQEITEDFVRSARMGAIDSARDAGIEDFMWIAVIDGKTDDCCSDRDGMSSSEIETALEQGKLSEDDCGAIVPPGHFNCRCDCAPMTDDLPETEPSGYSSFNDWLETHD